MLSAFAGYDNSTVQFTWRDLTAESENASLVYELNGDATNVGQLHFVETIAFAQRVWQFEFRDLGSPNGSKLVSPAIFVALLSVVEIVIIVLTVLFVRNRCEQALVSCSR